MFSKEDGNGGREGLCRSVNPGYGTSEQKRLNQYAIPTKTTAEAFIN